MVREFPSVTIVIPMRNEESYIRLCLNSLLSNNYPQDRFEILVVDGGSTDRSRLIVQEFSKTYPFVRMLDNPKRIQAAALNIGMLQK